MVNLDLKGGEKEKASELVADSNHYGRTQSTSDEETPGAMSEESAQGSGLPFSKARCIALVLTVTGASIMNVSCYLQFERVFANVFMFRLWVFSLRSSFCQLLEDISVSQTVDSNGLSPRTILPLDVSLCVYTFLCLTLTEFR
jgi:hypothetical protein